MNENVSLTDKQISRRKTVAVWLIGIGLVLIPLLYLFCIYKILGESEFDYPTRLIMGIGRLSTIFEILVPLLLVAGLTLICKILDDKESTFIKHWIIAIVGMFVITVASMFSGYNIHLTFVDTALIVYMIGAINNVCENGKDIGVRKAAGIMQTALMGKMLTGVVINTINISWSFRDDLFVNTQDYTVVLTLIFYCIVPIVLFIGLAKLVRSSLFASTSAQIEEYAQRPKVRLSFANARVFGAVAGAILCFGLTLVITLNWYHLYYSIV